MGPLSSVQGYEKPLTQVVKLRLESTCMTEEAGDDGLAPVCFI